MIKEDLSLEEDELKDEPETSTGGTVTPVTTVAAPADAKAAAKTTSDGKLIVAEEVSRGRVHWSACELIYCVQRSRDDIDSLTSIVQLYFGSMAGKSPILYWTTFLGGVLLVRFVQSIQAWYLGYWSEQYEKHDPSEVNPLKYVHKSAQMLEVTNGRFSHQVPDRLLAHAPVERWVERCGLHHLRVWLLACV